MSTDAQITANRRNAKKSTGPKTPEGKAKSSLNALKHGLTASTDVIRGESQAEYDAHRDRMIHDLAPKDSIEEFLADRAASLAWRLKRATRMQNQFHAQFIADHEYELKHHPGWRDHPSETDPDLILGYLAKRDYRNDKVLDRLTLYERRIESSFHKCLHALGYPIRKKLLHPGLAPTDPSSVIPAQAGIQDPRCVSRRAGNAMSPQSALQGSQNLCPRGSGAKNQTQSREADPSAITMESELYHLCAGARRALNKANGGSFDDPQDPPKRKYKTTVRRY